MIKEQAQVVAKKILMPWAVGVFVENLECQAVPEIPLIPSQDWLLRGGCAFDLKRTFERGLGHITCMSNVSAAFVRRTHSSGHSVCVSW